MNEEVGSLDGSQVAEELWAWASKEDFAQSLPIKNEDLRALACAWVATSPPEDDAQMAAMARVTVAIFCEIQRAKGDYRSWREREREVRDSKPVAISSLDDARVWIASLQEAHDQNGYARDRVEILEDILHRRLAPIVGQVLLPGVWYEWKPSRFIGAQPVGEDEYLTAKGWRMLFYDGDISDLPRITWADQED